MSRKVLFLDTVHPILQESLEKDGYICDQNYTCDKAELEGIISNYFGLIIRSRFVLDAALLDKAKSLKFIGRSGSGMENIDLIHANSIGIQCFNSPEGNKDAVGEHALGMLLSLFNKIHSGNHEVRQGKWLREENRGIEIGGKSIGIIGFGNTGSSFANKLKGFDCEILAYDKFKKGFGTENVKEVELKSVFIKADILSVHIPFNEENQNFINDEFFASFKKPIYFINTSRGGVLKTSALADSLKMGKVKGACLDVLEYELKSFEKLDFDDMPEDFKYLAKSDRTILSPHVAGWTVESYMKLSSVLYEKIKKAQL